MITVSLNNEKRELQPDTSITAALQLWGYAADAPIAIAVNQAFVPRQQYPGTLLRDRDQVDIVQPISGG